METDKKSLKKMFPNLYKELEGRNNKVSIDAVRTDSDEAEKPLPEKFNATNYAGIHGILPLANRSIMIESLATS